MVGVLSVGLLCTAAFCEAAGVREDRPNLVGGELAGRGIIVTARGDSNGVDFVSRFFAPRVGVPEDPVTGSAHCALAPYWAERLGKNQLHAVQVSARMGELFCELRRAGAGSAGERV